MLTIVKKNDSYDAITYQLENEDNSTVDLTGASVNFVMGKKNKLITNAKATVTSATSGIVSYQLTPSDTLVSGTFLAEFVVTFANGTTKTYPSNGYITVDVEQNLDTSQNNVVLDMIATKQGDFEAKLDSILKQGTGTQVSAMNEYTWTATSGQTIFVFPTSAKYDPSAKWFQVSVGNVPIATELINRASSSQFSLVVDPSLIVAGMTVHAMWVEPIVPITGGHHSTHEINGQDEINIANLRNYQELVATPIASNTTTLAEKMSKGEIFVNVKDYGAKGDGITNDTSAIQSAIDYVFGQGGGTVALPSSGIFLFTSITVKTNVRFKSYGATLKLKDSTCVNSSTSYYLIHNMGYTNGVFDNLIIDGNRTNNISYAVADGITAIGENTIVKDCYIHDVPDSGIMFSGVTNGLCINNRIKNGGDTGIYINDGDGTTFHENVVSNNRITDFPASGIALKRITQRTIVEANTIYNCGNGITLEQASTATDYSKDISVVNNRLRYIGYINPSAAQVGINLRASDYSIVSGNRLDDIKKQAIYIEGTSHSTVKGNIISFQPTVDSQYGNGIELSSRDALGCNYNVIEGNIITNAGYRGIYLSSSNSSSCNVISKNIVKNPNNVVALRINATFTKNIITENVLNGGTNADIESYSGANDNKLTNNVLVNNIVAGYDDQSVRASYLSLRDRIVSIGTTAPTAGNWIVGDVVWNISPVASGTIGWVCTTAGSPGTWKTFGNISA